MAAPFPDPNSFVAITQASGDQPLIISGTSKNIRKDGPRISARKGRATGNVVFAAPTQVKREVTSSSQNTQAAAVSETGGSVTVLQLAHQPKHAQFVIQPNQQSLIQAQGSATLQSLQLPKNMILLNRLMQGPIMQSTDGDPVQLITTTKDNDQKERRIIVARKASNDPSNLTETVTIGGTQYLTSTLQNCLYQDNSCSQNAIQLATSQKIKVEGMQTSTMANADSGATKTLMQYAQNEDKQFFYPSSVSDAGLQAYQIRASTSTDFPENAISGLSIQSPSEPNEAFQKRELKLLRNREAAKECRRKKKEYIDCLENRVAVLEKQNLALIEELKILKERNCEKTE